MQGSASRLLRTLETCEAAPKLPQSRQPLQHGSLPLFSGQELLGWGNVIHRLSSLFITSMGDFSKDTAEETTKEKTPSTTTYLHSPFPSPHYFRSLTGLSFIGQGYELVWVPLPLVMMGALTLFQSGSRSEGEVNTDTLHPRHDYLRTTFCSKLFKSL